MIHKKILNKISDSLSKKLDQFKDIKLMEDELNIDKYLKIKIIEILREDFNDINENLRDDNIKLERLLTKEEYYHPDNKRYNEDEISNFCDLVLVYQEDGIFIDNELEIKKTNSNKIPGSSINQIKPEKALLFFRYKKDEVELQVGYYYQSIDERIPFPDRSPRPIISYDAMKHTNKLLSENEVSLKQLKNRTKNIFADNWIDQLVSNWMDDVKSVKLKRSWFFSAIRQFCLKSIIEYEKLSDKEKKEFKKNLKK